MSKSEIKIGQCTNEDCDLALCYERQKIDMSQPDAKFECELCHHPLTEVSDKKKGGGGLDSKMMIIIGAVVAVGIVVALIFAFGGSKEEIIEPVVVEEPTDSVAENFVVVPNRNDTLVIKVDGMESTPDTVTVVEFVEKTVEEESPAPAQTSRPEATKAPVTSSPSSKNLGYGTWTGGLKNGQPHGVGTLTYSTSHTIDPRDTKGRVAQPGEYIVGEWDNGHLVQGRWFKKDGTKEAVIIGKAG